MPPRQGLLALLGQLDAQLSAGKGCAAALIALGTPVAATTALCNVAAGLGIDIVSYLRQQL